jgi:hypothetical protein
MKKSSEEINPMSSFKPSDWEQKLRDLEKEVNGSVNSPLPNTPLPVRPFNPDSDSPQLLNQALAWFQGLTAPAKVVVAVGGIVLALTLLNTVLKLVASLIAIAIMGVILYALYRAFIASNAEKDS